LYQSLQRSWPLLDFQPVLEEVLGVAQNNLSHVIADVVVPHVVLNYRLELCFVGIIVCLLRKSNYPHQVDCVLDGNHFVLAAVNHEKSRVCLFHTFHVIEEVGDGKGHPAGNLGLLMGDPVH